MSAGRGKVVLWSTLGVLLAAGCSTAPAPYAGSPERGQMRAHFDLADDLREAAVQGDVARFRDRSQALADLDPVQDLSSDVILQLGPMRWEARTGANARSLEDATKAAAEVARTCGECHTANAVAMDDDFVFTAPLPEQDTNRHMAGLAWTTLLLWEGLVGPSEAAWGVGAQALMESGALPDELLEELSPVEIRFASGRLRSMGREASGATDAGDRARILAQIWGTCAGCHVASRGR